MALDLRLTVTSMFAGEFVSSKKGLSDNLRENGLGVR